MLIADLIEKFIDYLISQKGYSDHTIRNYRKDLEQFLGFLVRRQMSSEKRGGAPDLESAIEAYHRAGTR